MKLIRIITLINLLGLTLSVHAAGFFLEGGVHLGGDTLVKANVTNGGSDKLKAGQLISMKLGLHGQVSESLVLRGSIGFKGDVISADNGDADFIRIPVDLLFLTDVSENWRLGAGITRHLSPEISTSGIIGNSTTALDDATGAIIAFDYSSNGKWDGEWYVGGRITLIDYENAFGSVSGNSVGAVIGYLY